MNLIAEVYKTERIKDYRVSMNLSAADFETERI